MPIGWFFDLSDADNYFANERLETDCWDALDSGDKDKALLNAYNRIFYDPDFSVPTYATATAAQLVILCKAQGEMAYYLCIHLHGGDEDRRKGIQAQGVIRAGVVKEDYAEGWLDKLPVPPFVAAILAPFFTPGQQTFLSGLDRIEDADVHEKISRPTEWDFEDY